MGVLGCCFVVRRVCYVSARGMCGCRCRAVRRCPGKCVVWRGFDVRLLVGGCPSRRCHPWAWFGLWPVVGVELACGVWGFQGRCRWGGVGCGAGVALRRSCVGGLWCFMSSGGGGGAVWHGGAGLRGGLPGGGGGRVQVWWGEWLLVAGPRALWGGPVRSPGRPSGVFQYVGRVGSLWCGAWGPLGRGVWDWSVATRGVWSHGAWGYRPTGEWPQWCRECCVWATRRLPHLRGLRVGGSRRRGHVAAPLRRPYVRSGGAWLGCTVSMVGGGAVGSGYVRQVLRVVKPIPYRALVVLKKGVYEKTRSTTPLDQFVRVIGS